MISHDCVCYETTLIYNALEWNSGFVNFKKSPFHIVLIRVVWIHLDVQYYNCHGWPDLSFFQGCPVFQLYYRVMYFIFKK